MEVVKGEKGEERRKGRKREGGERKGGAERRGEERERETRIGGRRGGKRGREGRGGQERKRLLKNLYWLKISKLAQKRTQEFEKTSNRIKTKQLISKPISVNF